MSTALPVLLTTEQPDGYWKPHTPLIFNEQGAVIVVGEDEAENLRRIQKAGRLLDNNGVNRIEPSAEGWDKERQWALAKGFTSTQSTNEVVWHSSEPAVAEQLSHLSEISRWARALINAPAEELYPETLAQRVIDYFEELVPSQVSYNIIKGDDLLKQGWAGIHAVGRASVRQPLMLQLDINPTGDDNAPVAAALVGKGITFDSGGYSIKGSEGMLAMKCDMGGAATLAGALALAVQRGLKQRVRLILCCAENLIDGSAFKLGDIITYKNGLTVEVVNTDAEGRLVLADGLQAAAESGAKWVIDAATLTGAAQMAVGKEYNALFSVDDGAAATAINCAAQERELLWRLPLAPWHSNNCPSPFADTANSRPQKGGGPGGASNAAGFLLRFAPNDGNGWLHFDLASAYLGSADAMWSAGATGHGIRTIAATLLQLSD
ncbi:aminopeptidase PepB [Idiomarina tyrosinivorans]|uniref:Aminopeptidase PepB n=1 Tax=Idiomarina tyrosinivorans TaxID=1445662 RepID=A0A432ZS25_9GAMM|nr:aminopeptidase PepB [Idiomarina tyrosinivorans]RUO80673.1 aminopeptidase PepB [Idiomarina tyrosinivorans]